MLTKLEDRCGEVTTIPSNLLGAHLTYKYRRLRVRMSKTMRAIVPSPFCPQAAAFRHVATMHLCHHQHLPNAPLRILVVRGSPRCS